MTEVFRFAIQRPIQRAVPKDVEWKIVRAYHSPTETQLHADLRETKEKPGATREDMHQVIEEFVENSRLISGLDRLKL